MRHEADGGGPAKKRRTVQWHAADALSAQPGRRVAKFSRDGYAAVWPAGSTMFAYMFAHEARHRGQILMLAHQLRYRLPVEAAYGIWHWEKLWKQQDLGRPR